MTITKKDFTEALQAIVKQYGTSYVYQTEQGILFTESGEESCFYHVNGQPSCLIFHFFYILGLEYDPEWEGLSAYDIMLSYDVEESLADAAAEAQATQDLGGTWGQALVTYEQTLRQHKEQANA